jgi:predicted kinase
LFRLWKNSLSMIDKPTSSTNDASKGDRPPPVLIIVQGAPGSGKTTIARHIAKNFSLPLISKDDIKESLFDSLGWKDRAWSKQLGKATMRLLYLFAEAQLAARRSFVIESNFSPEFATVELQALKTRHIFLPIQVVLECAQDILVRRYRERWSSGARHPGHVDDMMSDEELTQVFARNFGAMDIGGAVFKINTTHFENVDEAELFRAIDPILRGNG